MKVNFLARGALIAALYAVITVALAPISYTQIQVRVSEALTVLPYIEGAAIPGLYIGVIIANIYGGLGPWDIFGGSFLTLIAATLTWLLGKFFRRYRSARFKYLGAAVALLPPVIINAFGVAYILKIVAKNPYWITVLFVGTGQTIAVYLLGYPLLLFLLRSKYFSPDES
ncbi:MAG TPA: QueT transporter family protein [Candidatus Subteraquimicrobiales bacterium]